jgi:hypothetical protein
VNAAGRLRLDAIQPGGRIQPARDLGQAMRKHLRSWAQRGHGSAGTTAEVNPCTRRPCAQPARRLALSNLGERAGNLREQLRAIDAALRALAEGDDQTDAVAGEQRRAFTALASAHHRPTERTDRDLHNGLLRSQKMQTS